MPTAKKIQETETHCHTWGPAYDLTEKHCTGFYRGKLCKKILISPAEFNRRMEEWQAFYEMCKTTESYRDYQAMKEAWRAMDKTKIAEIFARVKTRVRRNEYDELEDLPGVERLPKPKFPDPEGGMYVIN